MLWMIAAILSAVFAGMTSILAKCGIKKTDSDLATAIRTIVVLIFTSIRDNKENQPPASLGLPYFREDR